MTALVLIVVLLLVMHLLYRRRVHAAGEKLRRSEEKYRLLVENASDGIFVAQDGRFEFGNPKALDLVGYEAKTLRGRSFVDFIHPEDRAMVVERHFQRLKDENPPGSYSFRILRQDGSVRWVNLKTVRIDWEGRPATLNLLEDFTERKAAQEALEESEQMYRSLVERANDGIMIIQDERIVLCNSMFADWVELSKTEVEGRSFMDFVKEEDASVVLERHRSRMAGRPVEGLLEVEVPRRGGGVMHVEINAGLIAYKGAPANLAILRDITERKQTMTELRNKRVELDQIIEALPDAMVYTDTGRRILRVNPAFTRIFGWEASEVLGRLTRFLHPDEESFLEHGKLHYNREAIYVVDSYELVTWRKDGSTFLAEVVATRVRDAEGKIAGFLSLVRDISERREAEERIAHLEKQFYMAQKLEAVGRLAGGIAHDFSNVVMIIDFYIDLLESSLPESDPLRAKAACVREACGRTARLTRQLLAFSRGQVLHVEFMNLNDLIEQMMNMLQPMVRDDIRIRFVPQKGLERIEANPGQIEQVVMNLVINARDAMPKGGEIVIETRNVELDAAYAARHVEVRPGRYVMVAVSDTGSGILKEIQGQIFEPFFTTKDPGFGTGLGLSTVYGIVKQSGGNIWPYSEPGRGTTFKVYLPLAAEGEALQQADEQPLEFYGSETVVLVENEEWLLELVEYMLQVAGYKVLAAGNGEKALRAAEEHGGPVDLLLTDVVMPGLSGPETAERLLKIHPRAKVLYMSGYSEEIVFRENGEGGEKTPFISKPFTAAELARKLRELLGGAPSETRV